jgi:DNA helicase IV
MKLNRDTSDTELIAIAKGLIEQIGNIENQITALRKTQSEAHERLLEAMIRADERAINLNAELNHQLEQAEI